MAHAVGCGSAFVFEPVLPWVPPFCDNFPFFSISFLHSASFSVFGPRLVLTSEFRIQSGFPAFRSGLNLLNSVWRTEWPFSLPALGCVGRGSARSVGATLFPGLLDFGVLVRLYGVGVCGIPSFMVPSSVSDCPLVPWFWLV